MNREQRRKFIKKNKIDPINIGLYERAKPLVLNKDKTKLGYKRRHGIYRD